MTKKLRLVTALISDSSHTIHLIELKVNVALASSAAAVPQIFQVDMVEVGDKLNARLIETGRDSREYDLVGVLVAQLHGLPKDIGRITWATDVSRKEVPDWSTGSEESEVQS